VQIEPDTGAHSDHFSQPQNLAYDHARWEGRRNFLRFLMRVIGFTLIARMDGVEGLENIPLSGPTIVMINHIAFIDPMAVIHVYPRNIVPMAKREALDLPLIGIFPKIWGVIPVDREGMDRKALRMAEQVLGAGEAILIAPEGTRGSELKEGREGVAFLAARTGAPILPTAVEGTKGFPTFPFSSLWRNQRASVRFGAPFRFKTTDRRPDRDQLRLMTDEAMIALARLLPEQRRGVYADQVDRPLTTIQPI
jgi:1-acyl-sn-glycerol-3-phosphate acyltransferase